MKKILAVILLLSGISIQAVRLGELDINKALIKQNNIAAWQSVLNVDDFISDRDKEVADLHHKDLKNMRSVRDILISQAAELIELTKQSRQVILVSINDTEWGLSTYGPNWFRETSAPLLMQLNSQIEGLIKEFKPIPKDWTEEIIQVKVLAIMVDNQAHRLKLVVNSKINTVRNALAKLGDRESPLKTDLKSKEKLLSIVLNEVNKIDNDGPFSPKKINESIQKFAEYLLTLSADKLPKIDDVTLTEIEAPYRSYFSILKGYFQRAK